MWQHYAAHICDVLGGKHVYVTVFSPNIKHSSMVVWLSNLFQWLGIYRFQAHRGNGPENVYSC